METVRGSNEMTACQNGNNHHAMLRGFDNNPGKKKRTKEDNRLVIRYTQKCTV
jgi:hypothetical protein